MTLEERIASIIDEQAMFDMAGVRNAREVARAIVRAIEREKRKAVRTNS